MLKGGREGEEEAGAGRGRQGGVVEAGSRKGEGGEEGW